MENSKINRNLWKSWDQAVHPNFVSCVCHTRKAFFSQFAIEAMAEILDLPRMVMFQFANCKRLPEAGEPLGKLPSVYLENGFWCDSDSESIDFFHYKKHGESVELTAHP